jgi:ABC-2 type transport system permease protein
MTVRRPAAEPGRAPVEAPSLAVELATVRALIRRAANEILRVPGAAIPGVLAPTIFFLGLSAVFGDLPSSQNTDYGVENFQSWILPISLLQGAGFTGAATGVNLARDIELGWFDRLIASPASRPALLAGMVFSASLRSLIPATVLLVVGFSLGVHWPGVGGLLLALLLVMATGTVAACWGVMLALRYRSQSAAPLMQAGMFVLILTTTAYAPLEDLENWLATIARLNPLTQVVEAMRQAFLVDGSVTWAGTWPGVLAIAGLLALLGTVALRAMRRISY